MRSQLFVCLLPLLALACTSDLAKDFSDEVSNDDSAEDDSADDSNGDDQDDDPPTSDDSAVDDSLAVDDSEPDDGVEAGVSEPPEAGVDDSDDDAPAADDVLSDDGMNDDVMADDVLTDDSLPDDSLPDDSLPDDSLPDDSLPDDSLPDDSLLDDGSSDDTPTEAGVDDGATDDSTPDPIEGGAPGGEEEASVEPPEALRVLEIVPAPGDDEISTGTNLVLSFDRTIELGSGTIEITNLDAAEVSHSLALDDAQVDVEGDTLTIDLDDVLLGGTNYAISIPPTVVSDGEGVFFAGLEGATWTFETLATAVPGDVPMADVALWLDAQLRGSIKHDAGAVRLWADRSPNRHHFTQTSAGARPMYDDGGLGSRAAIHFDGGSDWLRGPVIPGPDEFELFVVWQSPVVPSDELSVIFSNGLREDVNLQFIHGHSVDGLANSAVSYLDDDYQPLAFAPAEADTPYLWNASFGSDGFVTYTNGTESDSDAALAGSALDAEERVTLGGFDDEFFFEGDIGEVILFERPLTSGERDAVEAYIEARWGIGVAL